MTLVGFSLLPVWLDATVGSSLQFLSFLSCISFIFVGCVPDFRNDKGEYQIHVICGYLAAATALLSLMFVLNTWWIFLIFLLVNYLSDIKSFKESLTVSIFFGLIPRAKNAPRTHGLPMKPTKFPIM